MKATPIKPTISPTRPPQTWHGSVFRLTDGAVTRGPPPPCQPALRIREIGGAIQVWLFAGAGYRFFVARLAACSVRASPVVSEPSGDSRWARTNQ